MFQVTGEDDAVDASALKTEFFLKAVDLITEMLFEGNDLYGYIPKRLGSKGCYVNYKIVGVIIVHAFMTCGDIFGRCQEWVLRAIRCRSD